MEGGTRIDYGEFRAAAGVGAIRNEADYDRSVALIEAILDETHDTSRCAKSIMFAQK